MFSVHFTKISKRPNLVHVTIFRCNKAISREQPRIEAKVDVQFLGGASNDVVVKARLDTASSIRLTETYESAAVLGQTIDVSKSNFILFITVNFNWSINIHILHFLF